MNGNSLFQVRTLFEKMDENALNSNPLFQVRTLFEKMDESALKSLKQMIDNGL